MVCTYSRRHLLILPRPVVGMPEQVLDTPRPAAIRCRARTDNVAGVKLPVFESYETGSEVGVVASKSIKMSHLPHVVVLKRTVETWY